MAVLVSSSYNKPLHTDAPVSDLHERLVTISVALGKLQPSMAEDTFASWIAIKPPKTLFSDDPTLNVLVETVLKQNRSQIASSNPLENDTSTVSLRKTRDRRLAPIEAIRRARNIVRSADLPRQAEEAERMLVKLLRCLDEKGLHSIPPIEVVFPEDGSVLIEWPFDKARLGISLESDINSAFWYLIDLRTSPETCSTGPLKKIDFCHIVDQLLS